MITKETLEGAILGAAPSLTCRDAKRIAAAILDTVAARVAKGEKLQLRGLMTGRAILAKGRVRRNPSTGETFQAPAKAFYRLRCLVPVDMDVELS